MKKMVSRSFLSDILVCNVKELFAMLGNPSHIRWAVELFSLYATKKSSEWHISREKREGKMLLLGIVCFGKSQLI